LCRFMFVPLKANGGGCAAEYAPDLEKYLYGFRVY